MSVLFHERCALSSLKPSETWQVQGSSLALLGAKSFWHICCEPDESEEAFCAEGCYDTWPRPCFRNEASARKVTLNGCLKTGGTPPNGHSKNDNDAKPWDFVGANGCTMFRHWCIWCPCKHRLQSNPKSSACCAQENDCLQHSFVTHSSCRSEKQNEFPATGATLV